MFWVFWGCIGQKESLDYELSTEELDFGVVPQGMWLSQGVRLLNTGTEDLYVHSVWLNEEYAISFSLEGDVPEEAIAPEEAIFFDVMFTPDMLSDFIGKLVFKTSSVEMPTSEIQLIGEGGLSIHDEDGDGISPADGDCNDDNISVFPGAEEGCNGVDNDCDGLLSEEERDVDGDGWSICGMDCDDGDAWVYPGAEERCDGKDSNCDGVLDDVIDNDGDGQSVCDGDCNDGDVDVFSGGIEVCDFVDNDCDGVVDDLDEDGDGHSICGGGGDCDDGNPLAYPVVLDTTVVTNGDGSVGAPFRSLSSALGNLDEVCRTVLVVPGTHEVEASWTGDAVRILGGGEYPEDTTIKPFLTNSRAIRVYEGATMMLENLTAFGGESNAEGSILLGEEDSVVELHNVVFFDNHTTSNGGAVKIQGGALFVWNSEFSYNSSGGMGGALYVENGEFYDEGSSFVANEGLEGGGLAMMGGSLMLSETRFKGNIAMDGGGAWVRDIEDVLLTDVELLDNEASRSGGGLALINATVPYVFKGMHVQGNSALDSGGGIWLVGAHGVGILANSTFVDNIAGVSGGGVYMDPDASSGGNWIWSNVFSYGGGLFLSGSAAGNVAFNLCWDVVAPCLSISEEMDFGENLDEDPLFVNFIDDGNLVGDNLSLDVGSPGIDSGPLDGEGPIYFLDWNDEDGSRNDRGHTGGF